MGNLSKAHDAPSRRIALPRNAAAGQFNSALQHEITRVDHDDMVRYVYLEVPYEQ